MIPKNTYINIRAISIASIIGLVNSFFFKDLSIMLLLSIIEVTTLLYYFVRRKYSDYVCLYLIFLAFSMESGNFVGHADFYGFKNFRILGINLAVWMLLPLIIITITNWSRIYNRISSLHKKIIRQLSFFTIIGIVMGLIVFGVDDYGIASAENGTIELINSFYGYILPYLSIISVTGALLIDKNLILIKQYLFACIPATAIIFLACLITGNYGNRMGLESLQVSEIYFLLIASLILISYKQFKSKEKVIILLSSITIAALSIIYNASGKILIIVMLIPLFWLYIIFKQSNNIKVIKNSFIVLIITIIFFQLDLSWNSSQNLVLETKFADVAGLININSNNWISQIPESPRMRITEFMNVGYEYYLHPWYAIFGKGFGGCIRDNLNLFGFIDEAAFPSWQLELKAYKGLHESFNTFFLAGGLVGLYILFSILFDIFKHIYQSPWLLFGGLWLLLFYGYHMNVSIFGIVSLVVGIMDISTRKSIKLAHSNIERTT